MVVMTGSGKKIQAWCERHGFVHPKFSHSLKDYDEYVCPVCGIAILIIEK